MTESLADRIKRLRVEADQFAAEQQKRVYQSGAAKTARDFATLTWFLAGLAMGLQWIWAIVLIPVWLQVRRPGWWLIKQYVKLWDYVTIIHDPYGKPVFSKTRAGLMVLATLFSWGFLLAPVFGLVIDTAVYTATARIDDSVILFGSQEIDAQTNTHSIEGCWDENCGSDDSFYFRVRWSLFNQAWNFLHFKGVFRPDYIAAAVPTGKNRCIITHYGIRLSAIVRNAHIFPDVLAVKSCKTIGPQR